MRPILLTRVLGVVTRALSTAAKRRAGLRARTDAETGVVTFIQRFGSALNLNIHLHLLALDGAYTFAAGRPRFRRARAPTNDEIERLLDALTRRVVRTLTRAGALAVDPDEEGASPYLNLERPADDALAVLESASVRYRFAVGPIGRRKTLRLQAPSAVGTATQDRRPRAPRQCRVSPWRHWFKHQDRERNVAGGQEIWNRELKRLRVDHPPRDALAEQFNATRFEDFLAALGRGVVSVPQLAGALQPYLPVPSRHVPKLAKRRRKSSRDVQICGIGGLLTQMAQCCRPLPCNPIVGYITRGRGVSIHRANCRNVLNLADSERARLIDVAWSVGSEESNPVEIAVEAYDRKGLLRDGTAVVSDEEVNIVALDSSTDAASHIVNMGVTMEVRNIEQLNRVLDRLVQLPNVADCRRLG